MNFQTSVKTHTMQTNTPATDAPSCFGQPWSSEVNVPPVPPSEIFNAGLVNHHIANTAYPIAHRKTIWGFRQARTDYIDLLRQAFARQEAFSLYAHIPFCERRCTFCEYTVVKDHNAEVESIYHQALLTELAGYTEHLDFSKKRLVGFDIGGGTPSLIAPHLIAQLIEAVVDRFQLAETFAMSIETTPKIAASSPDRIAAYRSFGIERISMGLQMVNPKLLRVYGRDLNTAGHNLQAVANIRKAGFQNFNIDVMYGFARQSVEDFRQTLLATVQLDPEVITLYRMRYKGTQIEAEVSLIDFQRVVAMHEMARTTLVDAGYHANPGKNAFSRVSGDPGTSAYLTERVVQSTPYLGLGLGAQTFTNSILAYNLGAAGKSLEPYLRAVNAGRLPIQDLYKLPPSEAMAKMIAVSFYFGQINKDAFRDHFAVELGSHFPAEIAYVIDQKLMHWEGSNLRLTEAGARVFPGVVSLFYSNAVKQHLISLVKNRRI